MEIWHVARELTGVIQVGGLGDAVAGLAAAAAAAGHRVTVLLPAYGGIDWQLLAPRRLGLRLLLPSAGISAPFAPGFVEASISSARLGGVRLLLLEAALYAEKQRPYAYSEAETRLNRHRITGTRHWDTHHLNLLLQNAAVVLARRLGAPDIFHCHDGHTAFLPTLLQASGVPAAAVVTIHNAGAGYHQEVHDVPLAASLTRLPALTLRRGSVLWQPPGRPELNRMVVDPLVLAATDTTLSTVSADYAREIMTSQTDDDGLGAALRRAGTFLRGITNGIDTAAYDPRGAGPGLPVRFDPGGSPAAGKRACRSALIELLERPPAGLTGSGRIRPGTVLVGFIGRMTELKGIDLLVEAIPWVLAADQGVSFVLMGQGESQYEVAAQRIAGGRVAVLRGFHPAAARLVLAAADLVAVPSRSEPCGLVDLQALLLGALPVVHAVGGLHKIRRGINGYSFAPATREALAAALITAVRDQRDHPHRANGLRRNGFRWTVQECNWSRVFGGSYLPLYEAAARRTPKWTAPPQSAYVR